MLDLKLIRENPEEIQKKLQKKDPSTSIGKILEIDQEVRRIKSRVEALKNERNQNAKQVGELKQKGEDVSEFLSHLDQSKASISALDQKLKTLEEELLMEMGTLPNLPFDEVKDSMDPAENVCLKMHLEKPSFGFTPKNHLELNESLNLFDFERASKIGGSGWVSYKGVGARLEWALINFMLDHLISKGFEQWILPLVGRPDILYGSAHLPKFEDQLYKLEDELYMIPTSEAVLNGIHFNEMIESECLPLKYTSYTPCFRREAGAAGSQERGLIRTHQFNKVEMFCITKPDQSDETFKMMVQVAEELLEALELHYRSMLLVTGDMSFASAKTIDLEVYLPGQKRYYEVSSISNCTDFQARRSRIRYKQFGNKPEFVHTLNGSCLATSRLMVALLENNQQEDGSITLPSALRPYFKQESLSPKSLT